jgi:hypothetical protein
MTGAARLELRREEKSFPLTVNEASMWSLHGEVPKDVPAGDYQLWTHNGSGGEAGWVRVDAIQVEVVAKPWMVRVLDVT